MSFAACGEDCICASRVEEQSEIVDGKIICDCCRLGAHVTYHIGIRFELHRPPDCVVVNQNMNHIGPIMYSFFEQSRNTVFGR